MDLIRSTFPGLVSPEYRAFHVWLPLPEPRAERICRWALAKGISLTPPLAPVVDASLAMGLRLCLGAPPRPALARALTTLKGLLDREEHAASAIL
jgi:DNA-binding transcriptional MocR family regulator